MATLTKVNKGQWRLDWMDQGRHSKLFDSVKYAITYASWQGLGRVTRVVSGPAVGQVVRVRTGEFKGEYGEIAELHDSTHPLYPRKNCRATVVLDAGKRRFKVSDLEIQ